MVSLQKASIVVHEVGGDGSQIRHAVRVLKSSVRCDSGRRISTSACSRCGRPSNPALPKPRTRQAASPAITLRQLTGQIRRPTGRARQDRSQMKRRRRQGMRVANTLGPLPWRRYCEPACSQWMATRSASAKRPLRGSMARIWRIKLQQPSLADHLGRVCALASRVRIRLHAVPWLTHCASRDAASSQIPNLGCSKRNTMMCEIANCSSALARWRATRVRQVLS